MTGLRLYILLIFKIFYRLEERFILHTIKYIVIYRLHHCTRKVQSNYQHNPRAHGLELFYNPYCYLTKTASSKTFQCSSVILPGVNRHIPAAPLSRDSRMASFSSPGTSPWPSGSGSSLLCSGRGQINRPLYRGTLLSMAETPSRQTSPIHGVPFR